MDDPTSVTIKEADVNAVESVEHWKPVGNPLRQQKPTSEQTGLQVSQDRRQTDQHPEGEESHQEQSSSLKQLRRFIPSRSDSHLIQRQNVQETEAERGHAGFREKANTKQVSVSRPSFARLPPEPSISYRDYSRKFWLFREIMTRGPPLGLDRSLLHKQLTPCYQDFVATHSTRSSCRRWLQQWSDPEQSLGLRGPMSPLWFLFSIIQHDTMSFLQLMNQALIEISQDTLDNVLMNERLMHWRSLISRFQVKLSQLEESINTLDDFLLNLEEEEVYQKNQTLLRRRATKDLRSALSDRISVLQKQTDKTNKSLVANMSILESRRGIAEAESVSKLTELAFLFLPLTFSASLFSMQVKELSSGVSIVLFVAVAGTLTILSYGLRLLIRSRMSRALKTFCSTRVRASFNLRPDVSIATGTYLRWFLVNLPLGLIEGTLGLFFVLFLMLLVMAAPLAILWTQGLPVATKVVISVFLVLIAIGFAPWAMLGTRPYETLFRSCKRRILRSSSSINSSESSSVASSGSLPA